MWDKLRNGEIQRDKIRVVLKIPISQYNPTPHIHEALISTIYADTLDSATFHAEFYISSTKIFSCGFIYNEHIGSKYNTSLLAYLPGDSATHNVTGEFTD